MEHIQLINQPLKTLGLVRPKVPTKVTVTYEPTKDKYVKLPMSATLYWKPF